MSNYLPDIMKVFLLPVNILVIQLILHLAIFFSAYTDSFTDPVAILAAINSKSSQNVLTDVNSNSNLNVSGESTEKKLFHF